MSGKITHINLTDSLAVQFAGSTSSSFDSRRGFKFSILPEIQMLKLSHEKSDASCLIPLSKAVIYGQADKIVSEDEPSEDTKPRGRGRPPKNS